MKKIIGLTLLLLSSFASAETIAHKAQSLTVLIMNAGVTGGSLGSGILLDKTHVITCAHMASSYDDELLVYTFPMGTVIKATIEYVDVAHDVALLKLDHAITLPGKIVLQPKIADGESVTIVGNALGAMNWLVSRGVVSGHEKYYLLTDASINHGNSGGPWVNDKGEVVGMSDWTIGPKDGMLGIRGGISAKQIQRSLDNYKKMNDFFAKLGIK